jgi:hypothetical protein
MVGLFALVAAVPATAPAQLIPIRTVPVAQADQFAIFPSTTLGMAGVSIAVPDALLDPFVNPAKGTRVSAPYFFGSPVLFSVTSEAGGGRTLPLAAVHRVGAWFGGLSLALQQVDAGQQNPFVPLPVFDVAPAVIPPPTPAQPRSHGNSFAFAMVGRDLPDAGLSLGGSLFWAGLHGIDGVDLLYANSAGIRQSGNAMDLRLGLLKEWEGDRSLEALVLYDRYRMAHDVTYLDSFWDPGTQQIRQQPRVEENLDYTDTWGLHLEYERPLPGPGWRIGWLATANRATHPKIPNYEIMNIPRDPGDTYAFNVGIGLSRIAGPATFGVDAIYEPIWSNTWADAAGPVATASGDTIPAGGKTIENDFRFSNASFRMGASRDIGRTLALQLGLVVRSTHYWLTQVDNIQRTSRNLEEQWVEWMPTWGVGLRFPELEIRYQGSVLNGTGRPGVAPSGVTWEVADAARLASNILVAPSGPLTLGEVKVVTHRVGLSLPLR